LLSQIVFALNAPLDSGCSRPLKGNPQQANYMIVDRRRFLTKSGAIAVGLPANSIVAQSSRAVTQPSPAIRCREQLTFFANGNSVPLSQLKARYIN